MPPEEQELDDTVQQVVDRSLLVAAAARSKAGGTDVLDGHRLSAIEHGQRCIDEVVDRTDVVSAAESGHVDESEPVRRAERAAQVLALGIDVDPAAAYSSEREQHPLLQRVHRDVDVLGPVATVDELEAGPADIGRSRPRQRAGKPELHLVEERVDLSPVVALT